MPHNRGDVVAWRSIRNYGPLGPRVGAAFAGIVIADTPDLQVFCTPAGSEKLTRAGVGRGANGRQIPSTVWDGSHRRGAWEDPGTVRVRRPGDS